MNMYYICTSYECVLKTKIGTLGFKYEKSLPSSKLVEFKEEANSLGIVLVESSERKKRGERRLDDVIITLPVPEDQGPFL